MGGGHAAPGLSETSASEWVEAGSPAKVSAWQGRATLRYSWLPTFGRELSVPGACRVSISSGRGKSCLRPHSCARSFPGQGPLATWRTEHWGPSHSPTSVEEVPPTTALRGTGRKCGQEWEGNCWPGHGLLHCRIALSCPWLSVRPASCPRTFVQTWGWGYLKQGEPSCPSLQRPLSGCGLGVAGWLSPGIGHPDAY